MYYCVLYMFHTHTDKQHLRMTVTLTALLKVHLIPCSIICLSQKNTPVSWSLTWQRYKWPFFTQEARRCSDMALFSWKKAHLFKFHCDLYVSIVIILAHVCVSHLVPDDVCVVAAVEARAGNLPTCTHKQIFTALFRLEAAQAVFLHHLEMEGQFAATGQPEHNRNSILNWLKLALCAIKHF